MGQVSIGVNGELIGNHWWGIQQDYLQPTLSLISMLKISEYCMELPDPSSYHDVASPEDVPSVSFDSITDFLRAHSMKFEDKHRRLYEEQHLQYVRISSFDALHYVTGTVWAEIKPSVK